MINRTWLLLPIILFSCSACGDGSTQGGSTVSPTVTETPQPTPTITPVLIKFEAAVWEQNPIAPIITYHQFKTSGPSNGNGLKIQLDDLRNSLQSLYDSGFSLVSLGDWLAGNLTVPTGRRPLILTMDDLFFTNQILLDATGQPSPDTGIGVIWQFSREHPDFGFHLSLFAVLGDKYYPFDPQYNSDPKYLGRNWENDFAQTIVWCLENDALVLNHTFRHGYLSNVDNPVSMTEFIHQLQQNDERLRYYLHLVERDDLIPLLGNIIALPGGAEPQSQSDWEILKAYQNPEGLPVQAILNIYSPMKDPGEYSNFTNSYDPDMNKYNIPRIVATIQNIQYLADHNTEFPEARSCTLSVEESQLQDGLFPEEQIAASIQLGNCPAGFYYVDGKYYDARTSPAVQLSVR